MPARPADQVAIRRRAVERAFTAGELTTKRVDQLARQFGVQRNCIYRDRVAIIRRLKDEITPEDRAAAKASILARVHDLYARCIELGHTSTAARLLQVEANITGANDPVEVRVTHSLEEVDPIKAALAILDPEAQAWARRTLAEAGVDIPGVLTVEAE